jgi:hypothetical protein
MGITDTQIRAISCDGPGCAKQIIYDRKTEKETFELAENVWLRATRVTQTADGRNLVYCSDVCEVKAIGTGVHNILEQPKIAVGNPAAIAAAAQAAANARQTNEAIKTGQPAKVQLS